MRVSMARCGSRRKLVFAVRGRLGDASLLSRTKKPTLEGMSTFARVILILLAIDTVLSVAVAMLMLSGYFC